MPTPWQPMPTAGLARVARQDAIDRWFGWWWRYMREIAVAFDTIVFAMLGWLSAFVPVA